MKRPAKGISNYRADAEFDGLSLYEKKAALVNREINAQGMGRYQWMVFALCGFGYMLDLLWAQAFGLIASPLQQELGFDDAQLGNLFTAFSAGLTTGAFIWVCWLMLLEDNGRST
jgi:sugar phosphate permease